MKKERVNSWGNIFNKNVMIVDRIESDKNYLSIGNQNSYGDASIPKGKYILNHYESKNVSTSVFDYQTDNMLLLFGVPGKSNVTIGGAIAADTHGKDNHWGGSFSKNVKKIKLATKKGCIVADRENNFDVFQTTLGGYGLTGSIVDVELYENNLQITNIYDTEITTGIGMGGLLSDCNTKFGEYWVGWLNLLGKELQWVSKKSKPIFNKTIKFVEKKGNSFPFNIHLVGTNQLNSLNIINNMYYLKNKNSDNKKLNYYETFYPLSYLTDTRNISAQRKIVQVQFSIPEKNEKFLEKIIYKLINKQHPLLCSIKKLSEKENFDNLSFHQKGWTVAIDFPYKNFNLEEIQKFYSELSKYEGKIYLAKDSTLNSLNFRKMYPNFEKWSMIVKELDPNNIFQSSQSVRLGLKNW